MTQPKTLDEIRDWFARRQGWERNTFGFWTKPMTFVYRDHDDEHPIPATLDAIAGLMPSGYHITVGQYCTPPYYWWAEARPHGMTDYPHDDSETPLYPHVRSCESRILAEATLAYLAQIEQDKEPRP